MDGLVNHLENIAARSTGQACRHAGLDFSALLGGQGRFPPWYQRLLCTCYDTSLFPSHPVKIPAVTSVSLQYPFAAYGTSGDEMSAGG